MIAEIHSKISRNGSNLTETSEDELTGNFFGHLRYLPFDVALKPLLINSVYPHELSQIISEINLDYWADNIWFWPYDKLGELDAYMEFDDVAIGIEVKYTSGLSSDDGADYSNEKDVLAQSKHQIVRECQIIERKSTKKHKLLLLVGSELDCVDIYTDVLKRELHTRTNVEFGYVTWQGLYRELRNLDFEDKYHKLIARDLVSLLKRKGFEQFRSVDINVPFEIIPDAYFAFNYTGGFCFDTIVGFNIDEEGYYEFKQQH